MWISERPLLMVTFQNWDIFHPLQRIKPIVSPLRSFSVPNNNIRPWDDAPNAPNVFGLLRWDKTRFGDQMNLTKSLQYPSLLTGFMASLGWHGHFFEKWSAWLTHHTNGLFRTDGKMDTRGIRLNEKQSVLCPTRSQIVLAPTIRKDAPSYTLYSCRAYCTFYDPLPLLKLKGLSGVVWLGQHLFCV